MNKNLISWIPWIVFVAIIVVALSFVDYGKLFNSDQTVEEKMGEFTADLGIDEINDDVQFDEVINVSEEIDFMD